MCNSKYEHENELLSFQARELKKSADAILNEVRKKINDVTKTMDLLKGIQKLRKLRSDRLKQQGEIYFPLSNMYIICCLNLRIGVYSLMIKVYRS